jgi:hypothetical protein
MLILPMLYSCRVLVRSQLSHCSATRSIRTTLITYFFLSILQSGRFDVDQEHICRGAEKERHNPERCPEALADVVVELIGRALNSEGPLSTDSHRVAEILTEIK